jgi:hypothetical protein
MFVTTTLESLQRKIGGALGSLEGGHLISNGALRRIACDANVSPSSLAAPANPSTSAAALASCPKVCGAR